jgi:hypothetical protein
VVDPGTVDNAVNNTFTGYPGLVALQVRFTVEGDAFNNTAWAVPAEPSIASSATTACEPQILNDDNFIKDLPFVDFGRHPAAGDRSHGSLIYISARRASARFFLILN